MSILVTGGAGYIGSHTVKLLQEAGKNVVVYDNLSRGHKDSVKDCPLIVGDLFDKKLLSKTIKDYNITSVIHFAADSLVGESMDNPQKYYHNNVSGTLSLLDVMLANNVKHIVFSSTAATYGEPDTVPITEDFPTVPTNVYGRTKLFIENILDDYDKAYGLKYIALRYFNVAGAYHTGEIREDHHPETHLIPIVLQVLLGKRKHLNIFGNDYPTPDGTCIRDYIHVCDLAEAHILALNSIQAGAQSNVYNMGNGNGFSVHEVVSTTEKVTGKKITTIIAERRAGDPARLIASSEKIVKELGWKPKFNSLEKIIESAWNWHNSNPDGFSD